MLLKTQASKYLIYFQELMKQDTKDGMKLIGANVVSMQVFVIINNVGIMKNLDVNVNN